LIGVFCIRNKAQQLNINISRKQSRTHPTHRHGLGLTQHTKPTAHKPSAVLPPANAFFCRLPTLQCSTFIFLAKHKSHCIKKIKELHSQHTQATKKPTHRRKLNNIKWSYKIFWLGSCKHALKKIL
jgi:hypothetical protein